MNDFNEHPQHTSTTAQRPTQVRRSRNGALRVVTAMTAILIALLLGLVTLSIIGYSTGLVPFLTGLVVAVLPVPVYVMLALWIDRYEAEPAWTLAIAFMWGALVAVFFALVINSFGVRVVGATFGPEAASVYGLSVSAPVVEETFKALALFLLFFWKRDEFDGIIDGIVYAAMVGLGFAMTENVKYYADAVAGGRAFGTFVVRGMFSPFAHPLFTSMTGIGLGIASQTVRRPVRYLMPLVGLLLAVILHSSWNTSIYLSQRSHSPAVALLMYFVVMVPIFIGVLLTVFFALKREGRVLREHLRAEVARGLLTEEEYERVCTVRGRIAASFEALTSGGFGAWRARMQFHGTASELAFHRNRVVRGYVARDGMEHEREESYRRQLGDLRARLEAARQRSSAKFSV
jgi:RsiW-degrading membrane proteinase PrsW (M82 family)